MNETIKMEIEIPAYKQQDLDRIWKTFNKEQIYYLTVIAKSIETKDKEIERLNKILEDIEKYIHNWNIEEIGEKTMLILNDILLIKNGMSNEVVRLKEVNK